MLQQNPASPAEAGEYYEIKYFAPSSTQRVLYAKGQEITLWLGKNESTFKNQDGITLTVPAGFSVRVVKASVAWR